MEQGSHEDTRPEVQEGEQGANKEQRLSRASQHFAGNSWSFQGTHKAIIHPTDFTNKGNTGAAGGH